MFLHELRGDAIFPGHVVFRRHHRVSVRDGDGHGVHEALRVRVVVVRRPLVVRMRVHVVLVVVRGQHVLLRQSHPRVGNTVIRRKATRKIKIFHCRNIRLRFVFEIVFSNQKNKGFARSLSRPIELSLGKLELVWKCSLHQTAVKDAPLSLKFEVDRALFFHGDMDFGHGGEKDETERQNISLIITESSVLFLISPFSGSKICSTQPRHFFMLFQFYLFKLLEWNLSVLFKALFFCTSMK